MSGSSQAEMTLMMQACVACIITCLQHNWRCVVVKLIACVLLVLFLDAQWC
jgi:hypothetical protein